MNTFNDIDTSPEVNKGKIPPKILLLVNEAYKRTIKSLQGTGLVPFYGAAEIAWAALERPYFVGDMFFAKLSV